MTFRASALALRLLAMPCAMPQIAVDAGSRKSERGEEKKNGGGSEM